MTKKAIRVIIWVLVGSCVLNLILAFNAGQKRKDAVSRVDVLNDKLAELDLRYKNAIQSYDAIQKQLKEAGRDLQEQMLFSETLKETLQEEQKKSQVLREELDKIKSRFVSVSEEAPKNRQKPIVNKNVMPPAKKKDRTTTKGW